MPTADALAAIFHGTGQPLTLRRLPLPAPGPAEALVRIRCATICGSDLHTVFGRRHSPAPGILGHEMTGEIVALGAGGVADFSGRSLALGERVTWSMVWSCGRCFYCERGLPSKCDHLFKFGHERIGGARDLTGAYAEYCHLPAGTAIFPVPEALPDAVAAPANCATATAAAVIRHALPLRNCTVAVAGAGMLGLAACAMAAERGARVVVALDPDPQRRQLALRFGAERAAAPGGEAREVVLQATAGRGVDAMLEFAGNPDGVESAIPLLRAGGHLVMAGTVSPTRPISLAPEDLVRRMIRLTGVYNYRPRDLGEALAFLARQHLNFPFEALVSSRFRLREINEAMADAESNRPLRAAVIPE